MDRITEQAVRLREALHRIPEPSMKETKTKEMLLTFLRKETDLFLSDQGSWFYAVSRAGKDAPSVAFRADFDAVTGEDGLSRHLCGHDGHAAILAAFAVWVSENRPEKNVFFIFQPGEESGEGALLCRKIFEQEKIDEIYGLHNLPGYAAGTVLTRKGTFACASTGLEICLTGAPAHAAYPEFGKNPAGAMAEIIEKVEAYKEGIHRGMVLCTVIGIRLGSERYGVSASEGTLRLTVRAEYTEEFEQFLSAIREIVRDSAEKHGLTHKITPVEPFTATENCTACVEKVTAAAKACGFPTAELPEPMRWSEDFGRYLEKVPGAFFGIGAGEDAAALHTSGYEFANTIIPYALGIYKELVK